MSQEDIDSFMAITGAGNGELAQNFLDMAGGNLDTAISLFFEHGGNAQLHNGRMSAIGNEGTGSTEYQSDSDIAQKLQNEAYGEEPVRAPDVARHETLTETHVFPGSFGGVGGSYAPLNNANDMYDEGAPEGIFNQREDNEYENDMFRPHYNPDLDNSEDSDSDDLDINDHDSDFEYVEEPVVELDDDGEIKEYYKMVRRPKNFTKEERLARLFRPPFEIITKLSLDDAKLKARKRKKWIMVNIQDSGIFQCQTLNRDLWSEKDIKRLIKKNFIFLQYQFGSRSAEPYRNFYNLQNKDDLPHIAILDPMTGERLKMWNHIVPKPEKFIEEMQSFLAQFSLDPTSTNPTVNEPPKPIDPTTLTEEQQMELAIEQSLGDSKQNPISFANESDNEMDVDKEPIEPEDKDIFMQIKPVKHEEPGNKPGVTTRIQIRTGDGKRFIRRFDSIEDTVRIIYEVIKTEMEGYDNCKFTLSDHHRHDLIEKLDSTINDAGLKNSSLLLEQIEDDDE
ncbi:similar to Saccharomyces cerevisiae YDR330W UBX5 UBX (ubiquitin regulatory X) domain- containing protein that interacts with Cdc48p [Maudiozyma barnettii]|uniref:Similar to Saccharomyces cerevisiae YDR330W UBX5 UBX (Ubiquitin regulatory X) domain- containing protein that interacts with Cdc48p n=1 Tax=Maudiozyma barnettii TaxID=61262 RepID=A0A8H2ZJ14_9SACH|nr:Ubx5p [Kazachstania barnettii]CAB4253792.1 similar to Saccharomyces cerevisiae YDR330W UBX5 UBX (ubiquitin regulatory X) domain- containing protein that interacts with Cdc48p [Kazachstania barnettii]CAD1781541.1 similar to Saccharomyces cerevisiae YDR330W UBX5 UBX (ubiquitin regulatory X) domain- containing protein that interacts with Cdc48p [Kazachstania barnettii]